jgi:hypothetical protein
MPVLREGIVGLCPQALDKLATPTGTSNPNAHRIGIPAMQQNGTHEEVASDDMPLPGAASPIPSLPNASPEPDDDIRRMEIQLFQLSGTPTLDLPAARAGDGKADSVNGTATGPKRTSTFREQAVSMLETRWDDFGWGEYPSSENNMLALQRKHSSECCMTSTRLNSTGIAMLNPAQTAVAT